MLRMFFAVVVAVFSIEFVSIAHAQEVPVYAEYTTKLAKPVLEKGTFAYRYRTMLERCAEEDINFARKYTTCSIGQGSDAQINFLIDRFSGEVYRIEDSEMGIESFAESDLLIVNPDLTGYYSYPDLPSWLSIRFYTFDEQTGKLVLITTIKPVSS